MIAEMKFKKATKGTYVYEETSNDQNLESIIPTLYIRKPAFQNKEAPDHIEVHVFTGNTNEE